MGKLWVFGDSNSANSESESIIVQDWMISYKKFLGYSPKNFSELLAEKLGMEIENYAMGGTDNYTIIERVTTHIKKFDKKNDTILIGLTSLERFRIADFDTNYYIPITAKTKYENYFPISKQTMEEMLVNRSHPLYFTELLSLIDLIRFALIEYNVYFWSICDPIIKEPGIINLTKMGYVYKNGNMTNITQETNGVVDDGHFGEKGNRVLAELFYRFFNETNEEKIKDIYNKSPKLI